MAEKIIANLTLDTYQRNKIPPLVIPQHDYGARYIRVRITEQGENVSVASGSVVSIIAKRMADGQSAAFSGSVNADGSVLVPVTQWMLDAPSDDVDCHVAVTGTGYQYSTTSFVISPQERENPSYLEEDDPRVNIVEEALIKVVEEADRAEEQADLAQSAASTAASDAKEAARQEVEQLVGQLGIVQTLGNSRMAVVSQAVTTGLYNRNAKRIANLEQGFNEQFETDSTVAYVKDVPEGALPYAEAKKVGGMTRKCTNLIPTWGGPSQIVEGITFTNNNDGTIRANGTATGHCQLQLLSGLVVPSGGYYLSGCPSGGVNKYALRVWVNNNINFKAIDDGYGGAFTFDVAADENIGVYIHIEAGATVNNLVFKPMINVGSTPLPYEPYFEGLRSAKVTEVESVGSNLLNPDMSAWVKEGAYYFLKLPTDGTYTAKAINKSYHGNVFSFGFCKTTNINDGFYWVIDNGILQSGGEKTMSGYQYMIIFAGSEGVSKGFEGFEIQVNLGSTALPYTPYLHHTLPIPVEVRGSENLIPFPYPFGASTTEAGVTSVANSDGSVTVNGTAERDIFIHIADFSALDGDYFISGCPAGGEEYSYHIIVDENRMGIARDYGSGAKFSASNSNTYSFIIYIRQGQVVSNLVFKPMLNEGTTALPYEPYSTVKGLDGYGWGVSDTVYNYIDWEKKQFVKRCASVDLGTLQWYKTSSGNNTYITSVSGMRNAKTDEERKQGWICEKYNASSVVDNTNLDNKSAIRYTSDRSFYIRDADYTDEETFKAAMSGVMLVYELATPEVTDISSLITEDNFIGVEGNGTLTFKNAYEYAVPSEVEYQVEV